MYYYPLLKPYVHYIPANFSGLGAAVAWCHTHDKECERSAARGGGSALLAGGGGGD